MTLRVLLAAALVLAPAPLLAEGGAAAPGTAEEKAEKQVREILKTFEGENSYRSDEPRVTDITALGRVAVAPLMRYLREFSGARSIWIQRFVARDALEILAAEQDFAALAEMLADRVFEAARPLAKLRNPKVVDALLVPISKGFVERDYVEDLRKHSARKEVRDAFVTYLEKFGRTTEASGARVVAQAIGELRIVEGIPILEEVLADGTVDLYLRYGVAKALLSLHAKTGLEALIERFSVKSEREHLDYDRHEAGELLNAVVGEVWYQGSIDFATRKARGNFEEAAAKFRAWWLKVENTIRWDPKKFKWTW